MNNQKENLSISTTSSVKPLKFDWEKLSREIELYKRQKENAWDHVFKAFECDPEKEALILPLSFRGRFPNPTDKHIVWYSHIVEEGKAIIISKKGFEALSRLKEGLI